MKGHLSLFIKFTPEESLQWLWREIITPPCVSVPSAMGAIQPHCLPIFSIANVGFFLCLSLVGVWGMSLGFLYVCLSGFLPRLDECILIGTVHLLCWLCLPIYLFWWYELEANSTGPLPTSIGEVPWSCLLLCYVQPCSMLELSNGMKTACFGWREVKHKVFYNWPYYVNPKMIHKKAKVTSVVFLK